MIDITDVNVYGWEASIRGMRNPMNSWDSSDSFWGLMEDPSPINPSDEVCFFVGEKDLRLMKNLSEAGDDHSKFLRMINVTVDITAPLYWWKEFDTYKVGTVANSCSTMHKIHDKEFTLDDFSCEHLLSFDDGKWFSDEDWVDVSEDGFDGESWDAIEFMKMTVRALNVYRLRYLVTKEKNYWWQMIQLLPSSYNQKRTVQLNYAVLKAMYRARKNHKLDEWVDFCKWCETLPYFKEICIE